jgi:hypothetical protein
VTPNFEQRIALACDEMDAAIRERTPDLDSLMRETLRLPRFTEFLAWKTGWAAAISRDERKGIFGIDRSA